MNVVEACIQMRIHLDFYYYFLIDIYNQYCFSSFKQRWFGACNRYAKWFCMVVFDGSSSSATQNFKRSLVPQACICHSCWRFHHHSNDSSCCCFFYAKEKEGEKTFWWVTASVVSVWVVYLFSHVLTTTLRWLVKNFRSFTMWTITVYILTVTSWIFVPFIAGFCHRSRHTPQSLPL